MDKVLSAKKTTHTIPQNIDPPSFARVLDQARGLLAFHREMGIDAYPSSPALHKVFLREPQPEKSRLQAPALPARQKNEEPAAKLTGKAIRQQLQSIAQSLGQCRLCGEQAGEIQGGSGPVAPRLFVVGDCSTPSAGENSIWEPESDELFWKMMAAIGLDAESVYVTNCVKCPAQHGVEEAVQRCANFLEEELITLQPSLICTMGEVATRQLLGLKQPLVRTRGRFYTYPYPHGTSARVMPTFHPRFLLECPEMKPASWQDLQALQRYL